MKTIIVATGNGKNLLNLYAVRAPSRADAIAKLYAQMRADDIVDLPPVRWSKTITLDIEHITTLHTG